MAFNYNIPNTRPMMGYPPTHNAAAPRSSDSRQNYCRPPLLSPPVRPPIKNQPEPRRQTVTRLFCTSPTEPPDGITTTIICDKDDQCICACSYCRSKCVCALCHHLKVIYSSIRSYQNRYRSQLSLPDIFNRSLTFEQGTSSFRKYSGNVIGFYIHAAHHYDDYGIDYDFVRAIIDSYAAVEKYNEEIRSRFIVDGDDVYAGMNIRYMQMCCHRNVEEHEVECGRGNEVTWKALREQEAAARQQEVEDYESDCDESDSDSDSDSELSVCSSDGLEESIVVGQGVKERNTDPAVEGLQPEGEDNVALDMDTDPETVTSDIDGHDMSRKIETDEQVENSSEVGLQLKMPSFPRRVTRSAKNSRVFGSANGITEPVHVGESDTISSNEDKSPSGLGPRRLMRSTTKTSRFESKKELDEENEQKIDIKKHNNKADTTTTTKNRVAASIQEAIPTFLSRRTTRSGTHGNSVAPESDSASQQTKAKYNTHNNKAHARASSCSSSTNERLPSPRTPCRHTRSLSRPEDSLTNGNHIDIITSDASSNNSSKQSTKPTPSYPSPPSRRTRGTYEKEAAVGGSLTGNTRTLRSGKSSVSVASDSTTTTVAPIKKTGKGGTKRSADGLSDTITVAIPAGAGSSHQKKGRGTTSPASREQSPPRRSKRLRVDF